MSSLLPSLYLYVLYKGYAHMNRLVCKGLTHVVAGYRAIHELQTVFYCSVITDIAAVTLPL